MRKWPTPTTATGPTCNEGVSEGAARSAYMFTMPSTRAERPVMRHGDAVKPRGEKKEVKEKKRKAEEAKRGRSEEIKEGELKRQRERRKSLPHPSSTGRILLCLVFQHVPQDAAEAPSK